MSRVLVLFLIMMMATGCVRTFYIVRHAEKVAAPPNISSDVSLTDAGMQRAQRLMEILRDKQIGYVFSTNTIRTKSTAQPTADYFHVPIKIYGPQPDSIFISLLRSLRRNALIVGHSNTVDDIVNRLCGEKMVNGDLPDSEYNRMFIVTRHGKKMTFRESTIFPR